MTSPLAGPDVRQRAVGCEGRMGLVWGSRLAAPTVTAASSEAATRTSPRSSTTLSMVAGATHLCMQRRRLPGRVGGDSHSTRTACAARTASHSRGATTPRKSPRRSNRASGMAASAESSTRQDAGAGAIRGLATGPDDARVQHAGQAQLLDVGVRAVELARPGRRADWRCATRRYSRCRLQGRLAGDGQHRIARRRSVRHR